MAKKDTKRPNDIDVAWFAGLFEGEGTITIRGKGLARLAIKMTDRDILERVDGLFPSYSGLKVQDREPHKRQYTWYVNRAATVKMILTLILPLLGERRRLRAQEALYALTYLHSGPPGSYNAKKTECKHGHLYSPENTYVDRTGRRTCRICKRESSRRYKERIDGR